MRLLNLQQINEMAKKKTAARKGETVIDSVEGPITAEQLEQWLEEYEIDFDEYNISNGRLNIDIDFGLDAGEKAITQIPVPLGQIDGDFNASVDTLTSFNNTPLEVNGHFFCYDTQISSFEGLNIACNGKVDLSMNRHLQSLRGVHKYIRKMKGPFKFDLEYVQEGGLGLMLIEGITSIDCGDKNINDIFNKYLKKGLVFEAQEHLIDGGYAYLARL